MMSPHARDGNGSIDDRAETFRLRGNDQDRPDDPDQRGDKKSGAARLPAFGPGRKKLKNSGYAENQRPDGFTESGRKDVSRGMLENVVGQKPDCEGTEDPGHNPLRDFNLFF